LDFVGKLLFQLQDGLPSVVGGGIVYQPNALGFGLIEAALHGAGQGVGSVVAGDDDV